MLFKAQSRYKLMLIALATATLLSIVAPLSNNNVSAALYDQYATKCGSGWRLKAVKPLSWQGKGSYSWRAETRVYIRQSGSYTDWCAITVRKTAPWRSGFTYVGIYVPTYGNNKKTVLDYGDYSYYAGPVKMYNKRGVYVVGEASNLGWSNVPFVMTPYGWYLSN